MLVTVHVSCTETACCEQVVDLRKRPEYIQMDIIIYQPFNVCLVTFVCVFSCFHTAGCEACSFTTDRYGIFNVRTYSGLCSIHDGGSGTYIQVCTRVASEGPKNLYPTLPRQGIEPRVFGFDLCVLKLMCVCIIEFDINVFITKIFFEVNVYVNVCALCVYVFRSMSTCSVCVCVEVDCHCVPCVCVLKLIVTVCLVCVEVDCHCVLCVCVEVDCHCVPCVCVCVC